MDSPLTNCLACRRDTKGGHHAEGFSLLEMMMVVTLILIIASIATPIYRSVVVRAREAVLRRVPDGTRLRDDLKEAVSSQPSAFSEPAEN